VEAWKPALRTGEALEELLAVAKGWPNHAADDSLPPSISTAVSMEIGFLSCSRPCRMKTRRVSLTRGLRQPSSNELQWHHHRGPATLRPSLAGATEGHPI
jgi:hypothetical protein